MKTLKAIIAIAAITFSVPVNASIETPYAPHERERFCPAVEYLATQIMLSRQSGVPMGSMMQIANRQQGRVKQLNVALILKAFEVSQYSTKEFQRRAATEFASASMLKCYKDGYV